MALDRQSIEKRDFPIGRRGYEPAAVDQHLASVAEEVDSLRRTASRAQRGESLASAASAQVQAIVEAAEKTAAEIERQADAEARRIVREAEQDAGKTRDSAVQRAEGHVDAVSRATAMMLQRIDAMESEVGALAESLRTGANRLSADLALLEGNMAELYDAAGRRAGAPEPPARSAPVRSEPVPFTPPAVPEDDDELPGELAPLGLVEVEEEAASVAAVEEALSQASAGRELESVQSEPVEAKAEGSEAAGSEAAGPEAAGSALAGSGGAVEAEPDEAESEPPSAPSPRSRRRSTPPAPEPHAAEAVAEPEEEPEAGGGDDVDGARLIALNMALNGQPRDEADRYLAENFDLPDRQALLDEVYAAVE